MKQNKKNELKQKRKYIKIKNEIKTNPFEYKKINISKQYVDIK